MQIRRHNRQLKAVVTTAGFKHVALSNNIALLEEHVYVADEYLWFYSKWQSALLKEQVYFADQYLWFYFSYFMKSRFFITMIII